MHHNQCTRLSIDTPLEYSKSEGMLLQNSWTEDIVKANLQYGTNYTLLDYANKPL